MSFRNGNKPCKVFVQLLHGGIIRLIALHPTALQHQLDVASTIQKASNANVQGIDFSRNVHYFYFIIPTQANHLPTCHLLLCKHRSKLLFVLLGGPHGMALSD